MTGEISDRVFGKTFAIFGLGVSGLASASYLVRHGAHVLLDDDDQAKREVAAHKGFSVADLRETDWGVIDYLLLSPGVPIEFPAPHWVAERANAAMVPIIGDMEIFAQSLKNTNANTDANLADGRRAVIAVTGTNGKSTVTSLINHVLQSLGKSSVALGNLGRSVLEEHTLGRDPFYVLEVSSYQSVLTDNLCADVALLTSLSSDHLDRHGSLANYHDAKLKLLRAGRARVVDYDSYASYPQYFEDFGTSKRTSKKTSSSLILFDSEAHSDLSLPIVWCTGNHIAWRGLPGLTDGQSGVNLSASLRGRHNWRNAAAATAALAVLGIDMADILRAMVSFGGLPHRLEEIATRNNLSFVNDSKATNVDSAITALRSFSRPIFWLAGGLAKDEDHAPLRKELGNVTGASFFGQAASEFARRLGFPEADSHDTLDEAIASLLAKISDYERHEKSEAMILLFSPACASFDQYNNFAQRGEAFVRSVSSLDGVRMLPRASDA